MSNKTCNIGINSSADVEGYDRSRVSDEGKIWLAPVF